MFSRLKPLVERVRQWLARFRQTPAEAASPSAPPSAPTLAPARKPGNGKANGAAIQIRLQRRQVPIIITLVVANLAIIIVATVFITRALAEPTVIIEAPTDTPLSNTQVAERLPTIQIAVTAPVDGPSPTAPPNPLSMGGTVFYEYRYSGRANLWARVLSQAQPVRITAGPWDDRDPSVSPDGRLLAFSSRREGSWNLYVLNLDDGKVKRVTSGPESKGNPAWSPDSQWLVFEVYRNNNLDVAIVNVNSGEDVIYLTSDPAADYDPAWSPGDGRTIAWISMRGRNPDIWLRSLNDAFETASRLLAETPDVFEESPAFSPTGEQILYTDALSPRGIVYARSALDPAQKPVEAAQGYHPIWSPDGSAILTLQPEENGQDYVVAAPFGQPGLAQILYRPESGHITSITWSPNELPQELPGTMGQAAQAADAPLWGEVISQPGPGDPKYSLVTLPDMSAPDPRLSDRVDDAFNGLRRAVTIAAGWDFLATLDNAVVGLKAPPPPSMEGDSWLKAGRAFEFSQAPWQAGWVEVTREDFGFRTYWRVWVRARLQDGSMGEPLRTPPWDFGARYSGRPEPYDAGGEYRPLIPPGYFIDFTTLAEDYGWTRVPAQENWPEFYPGILYWRFEHRGGLTWLEAIREVYNAAQAATQTPVPSPTGTPTITLTPTKTGTPTVTRTPTRTNTRTPRPTLTRTITRTPRPTLTPTVSRTPRPIVITVIITLTPPVTATPVPVDTEMP